MIEILEKWNVAPEGEAAAELLPCNGSHAWARALVERRPFANEEELFQAADTVWARLDEQAWKQAFDSHPRIGERHAQSATKTSLKWSEGEQKSVEQDEEGKAALEQANRLYDQRFGRIFLVCATGKSAAEILSILQSRLKNDAQTEMQEAAEQQRRITQLRLRKWLGLPAARCEDV